MASYEDSYHNIFLFNMDISDMSNGNIAGGGSCVIL